MNLETSIVFYLFYYFRFNGAIVAATFVNSSADDSVVAGGNSYHYELRKNVNYETDENEQAVTDDYNRDKSRKYIKPTSYNAFAIDGSNEDKKLRFEKELYITQMERKKMVKDGVIPVEISLLNKEKTIKLTIDDADVKQGLSTNLNVTEKDGKIIVSVVKDFAGDELSKIPQLIFILRAVAEGQDPCHTIIILNLIDPIEPPSISFEQKEYRVEVLAEQRGIVGQYMALLKNKDKAIVKYKLHLNDEKLSDKLKLDEYKGTLSVIGALEVGTLDFKIEAQVAGDDTLKSETQIHLVVTHTMLCGSANAMFSYSLLTKHVPEEKTMENILPASTAYPNCQYSIASQKPSGDYFQLNPTSGSLSLAKPVDRESSIFRGMKIPAFTLELEIKCSPSSRSRRHIHEIDEDKKKSVESTEEDLSEIRYNPKKMILRIVIDDANDHPPLFSQKKITVGYPSLFSFIKHYPPPSLITVQATDKDAAKNAEIQYFIDEGQSSPFYVHPTTGTIYPWKYHDSLDDVSFTVVAKNKDGKSDNKQSRITVLVKFLLQPQIVEFIYENALPDEIPRVLKEASIAAKCDVKALTAAAIPYNGKVHNIKTSLLKPDDKPEEIPRLFRLLVYGISDDSNSRIIDGSDLSRNLKQLQYTLDAQPVPQETLILIKGREYSIFSLVLIFIGIVLIAGLILSHILYVKYQVKKKDGNSRVPLNDDAEPISRTCWMNSQFSEFNGAAIRKESNNEQPHQSNQILSNNNNDVIRMEKLNGDDIILLDSRNCRYLKACAFEPSNNILSTFKPPEDEQPISSSNYQQPSVATIPVTEYTISRPDVTLHHSQQQQAFQENSADNPFPVLPKPPNPDKHTRRVILP